jgi:uncharacterized protein (TIGR02265 family)
MKFVRIWQKLGRRMSSEERLDAELARENIAVGEFHEVDLQAPLDVEARIAETPLTATVKGMFMEPLARSARQAGVACEPRYLAFREYPLRDFMRLLASCARTRYPSTPIRDAFRHLGREAFPALMSSVAGRVIFTFARGDARGALRLAPEGYKHSLSHCSVRNRLSTPEQVVLELRAVWNFPECYHVGVVEGGCLAFGPQPKVKTRVLSPCAVDMLVRW